MKSILKNLSKIIALFPLLFAIIFPYNQIHSREWTIHTNVDAFNEEDYQKLSVLPQNEQAQMSTLKIRWLAFEICKKDNPIEEILEVITQVTNHPTRKFRNNPILIFTKITCISSSSNEENGLVCVEEFEKNSEGPIKNNSINLDTLPKDIFSIIIRNFTIYDVISLSKVNRQINEKLSRSVKKMCYPVSINFVNLKMKQEIQEVVIYCIQLFQGPLKFAQFVSLYNYAWKENYRSLLYRFYPNIKKLELLLGPHAFDLLESMNPENFPELRELGIHTSSALTKFDDFFKFPKLVGIGTKKSPILCSNEARLNLLKIAGNRLESLSIYTFCFLTSSDYITTINSLPLLKKLYLPYRLGRAIYLKKGDVDNLAINSKLMILVIGLGIYFEDTYTFENIISKFFNLRTFFYPVESSFNDGIDLSRWKKLEKLGISFTKKGTKEFWLKTLPKMLSLKVLSITSPLDCVKESFAVLSQLSNIEFLEFRNYFLDSSFLCDLANSHSKVVELAVQESCFTDKGEPDPNFLELTKLPELRILYSRTPGSYFKKSKKLIAKLSKGRIVLLQRWPDFFEEPLDD